MESETSRRFSRVRKNNGRRERRYKLAGKMGPELEVAVLVARVFAKNTRDMKKIPNSV